MLLVPVVAAVVVVVVAGRVVKRRVGVVAPAVEDILVHFPAECGDIVGIRSGTLVLEGELFGRAQSVESHVLFFACAFFVGERHGGACGARNVAPHSGVEALSVGFVKRQSVLESLLAVAQDVLAHVSEVDVEVAAAEAFAVGEARVHEPELYVLDVGALEVGVVEFAHYSAEVLLRLVEFAPLVNALCVNVVRSALFGVVGEVEHRHPCVLACKHLFVGVELLLVHNTCAVVGHGIGVALYVCGRIDLRVSEDGVHGVPCEHGAVGVVGNVVAQACVFVERFAAGTVRGC